MGRRGLLAQGGLCPQLPICTLPFIQRVLGCTLPYSLVATCNGMRIDTSPTLIVRVVVVGVAMP